MKPLYMSAALATAILLSACGPKADKPEEQSTAANTTADMGNMAMLAETDAKKGKGTGSVTAIDKTAGKITLDHGPIPEVGWPAMTMAFTASKALLGSVAVGDKVAFDVTIKGNASELTAITKQ